MCLPHRMRTDAGILNFTHQCHFIFNFKRFYNRWPKYVSFSCNNIPDVCVLLTGCGWTLEFWTSLKNASLFLISKDFIIDDQKYFSFCCSNIPDLYICLTGCRWTLVFWNLLTNASLFSISKDIIIDNQNIFHLAAIIYLMCVFALQDADGSWNSELYSTMPVYF